MLVCALGLIACGGGSEDGTGTDAAGGADAAVDAPADTASNHQFVVSGVDLPTNGAEAMALGLDIDNKPNDGVDNQLGSVLGSLGALAPSLNSQADADRAVDRGTALILVNVKASSLADAGIAELTTYRATDQMTPPACADVNDTTCRHQFTGEGMFNIDTTVVPGPPIIGRITGGAFETTSSGEAAVTFVLFGARVTLPLKHARARLAGLTAEGWAPSGSAIGGAVTQADMNAIVLPAIADGVRATFAADCIVGGTPPQCGCQGGSTGATLRNLFDKAPTQDCQISNAEVDAVISGFLTLDIDLDEDGTNDALSISIGITGTAGMF